MAISSALQRDFLLKARRYVPFAEAQGVPGAVLVAQAILESNWGRSGLARQGAALFGIKATRAWRGAVYSGTTREWLPGKGSVTFRGTNRVYGSIQEALAAGCPPGSLFRAYPTVAANVQDYLQFFRANPRYHPALRTYARRLDPRRFAYDIAAAGYATAPGYPRQVIGLMERYVPDLLVRGVGPLGAAPAAEEETEKREGPAMQISGAMIEALVKLLQGAGLLQKPEAEVEFRKAVADLEKTKAQVWVDFVRATSPDPNRVYVWANSFIALVRPTISTMVVAAMIFAPTRVLELVRTFGDAGPSGWIVMAPVLWWFFGRDVGKVLAMRYGGLIAVGSGAAEPRSRDRLDEGDGAADPWPRLERREEVDGQLGSLEEIPR